MQIFLWYFTVFILVVLIPYPKIIQPLINFFPACHSRVVSDVLFKCKLI